MEVFLYIALLAFTLAVLFEKMTNFIKQLKSSKSSKLLSAGKTLKVEFQISSTDKQKSEVCARNTNSKLNGHE